MQIRKDTGFTLIEVVLGLSITAALAAILYLTLQHTIYSGTSISETYETHQDIRRKIQFVKQLMAQATVPIPKIPDAVADPSPFRGTSHSITFYGFMGPDRQADILSQVWISFKRSEKKLVLKWKPFDLLQAHKLGSPQIYQTVIFRNVTRTKISYLARQNNRPIWLNNWSTKYEAPEAVKINLAFNNRQAINFTARVNAMRVHMQEGGNAKP